MDIVTLAQRYSVRPSDIRKSGDKYAIPCICPLRNRDSNPSVILYVSQGSYFCFACHKGGTMVNMVAHAENISFKEAVRRLREIAGGNLPELSNRPAYSLPQLRETDVWGREKLKALMNIYHEHLLSLKRKHYAWRYLTERGVSEETVRHLKIGWTPRDAAPLLNGLSEKDLVEIGALTNENKLVLRNRIIFPVWEDSDAVYLIGRRIKDDENSSSPKYLGLRRTDHVTKSPFIIGNPIDGSIIVEGVMDAIALFQAGLSNRWRIIATLGFDKNHIEALVKKALVGRRMVIGLDQDDAGRNFALRLANHLKENHPSLECYIVTTPDTPLQSKEYRSLLVEDKFKDFGDLITKPEVIVRSLSSVVRPSLAAFMSNFLRERHANTITNNHKDQVGVFV